MPIPSRVNGAGSATGVNVRLNGPKVAPPRSPAVSKLPFPENIFEPQISSIKTRIIKGEGKSFGCPVETGQRKGSGTSLRAQRLRPAAGCRGVIQDSEANSRVGERAVLSAKSPAPGDA
jgi:hypothetical protein